MTLINLTVIGADHISQSEDPHGDYPAFENID